MSSGAVCRCPESTTPLNRRAWTVWAYRTNSSSFHGYRPQHSDYSAVGCDACQAMWRTKAAYVEQLLRRRT
ncbi:MAG TPA: hypothetical protein VIJ94_09295 [Caulobacteraceae bacterium]